MEASKRDRTGDTKTNRLLKTCPGASYIFSSKTTILPELRETRCEPKANPSLLPSISAPWQPPCFHSDREPVTSRGTCRSRAKLKSNKSISIDYINNIISVEYPILLFFYSFLKGRVNDWIYFFNTECFFHIQWIFTHHLPVAHLVSTLEKNKIK